MRTSNRRFDLKPFPSSKVRAGATVVAIAFTAAAHLGCGPATPHAGGALTTKVMDDAGTDAARTSSAGGGDAAPERFSTLVTVTPSAPGCVPADGSPGSDAGSLPAQSIDAGPDMPRDASADAPAAAAADASAVLDSNAGGADRVGGLGGSGGSGSNGSGGSSGIGSGGATGGSRATGGTVGTGGTASGGVAATGGVTATGGTATGGSRATGGATGTGGAASTATGGSRATGGTVGTGAASGGAAAGGAGAAAMGNGGSSAAPPALGDLAIVELLINPAGTDTGREWIEVVNRTTHAVSLVGLHVSDAVNDAAVDLGTGEIESLTAGARAVFIQSSDPTKNGGIVVGGAIPGGSFGTLVSLNNDADTVSICFGACATGVVVDHVSWDASLGTGYDGHALLIDDSARRCPATVAFGDGGSFGTPGAPNTPCP